MPGRQKRRAPKSLVVNINHKDLQNQTGFSTPVSSIVFISTLCWRPKRG